MKKKKKKLVKDLDTAQILLRKRQLFLFDIINGKSAKTLIRDLIALDSLNNKPIILCINSGGGNVSDGFSIIDTMKGISSPVITLIVGEACSMAGIISIAGDQRWMCENAIWMSHEMAGGIWGDYTSKVLDRADFLKKEQNKLLEFIKIHTKLNQRELQKAKKGELWLYPEECKVKGIIDKVLKDKKRRRNGLQ